MFCDTCGHDMGDASFCPVCGAPAKANTPQAPVTPVASTPNNMASPMGGSNFNQPGNAGQGMQPFAQQPVQPQQPMQPQRPVQPQQPMQPQKPVQPQQPAQPQQPVQPQQFGQPQRPFQPQQPNNYNPYGQSQGYNPYGQAQGMYNQPGVQGRPGMSNTPGQPPKPQTGKKKWPIFLAIGLAAVILAVVVIILVVNKKNGNHETIATTEMPTTTVATTATDAPVTTATPSVGGEKTTIMVYMVGSNLESKQASATMDITEMLQSGYDESLIDIVIYTGGAAQWQNYNIPNDKNCVYHIENGQLVSIKQDPLRNMGEPDTLTDFINYAYTNYPADQYALVLWDHGGGAFFGYGSDELFSYDGLTLEELSSAIAKSGVKFEFIGFDACLMATIETADILSPYANYLVASQEPEPGWGWDYSFLGEVKAGDNGAAIGTYVSNYFIETTTAMFDYYPYAYSDLTLSVLDLSKVGEVETTLNNLYAQINPTFTASTFPEHSRIRATTKEIASEFSGEESYDAIDLLDLAKKYEGSYLNESLALEQAVADLIVYNRTNTSNENGVSIYFPYNAKRYSSYYIPMYESFDFAPEYTRFISNFAILLNNNNTLQANWDYQNLKPINNGDYNYYLPLTPEQEAAYQRAYFVVSRPDTSNPGNYIFVGMNDMTWLDNQTAYAYFDNNVVYIENQTTGEQFEVMYSQQETTAEYTRYLLSCALFNESIEEEGVMYAYFVLEVTDSSASIIGCYPVENLIVTDAQELIPDRYEIDLNDYQYIAFGNVSHKFTGTEDMSSIYSGSWDDAIIWYNQFPITDGFRAVSNGLYDDQTYYGMFVIEDSQGNRHCSDLVQIK